MKHNLSESYLQSLTEEQRIAEMKEWTASEWQHFADMDRDYWMPPSEALEYGMIDKILGK